MSRSSQIGAYGRSRSRPPRSNAERSRQTRRALLDAGRAVLTERGYDGTTSAAIFRRAGVTHGAFYHHFPHKAGLFAAVFAEVCQEYIQAVRTCMQTAEGDTWERFVASLGVLLEQMGRPSVQRIVYVDGPAVLGRLAVYRHAPDLQFLRTVFTQLRAEGAIQPLPLDPCIHLVRAMCSEVALYIAQAEEREVAQEEMNAVLLRLLDGLRLPHTAEGRQGKRKGTLCS